MDQLTIRTEFAEADIGFQHVQILAFAGIALDFHFHPSSKAFSDSINIEHSSVIVLGYCASFIGEVAVVQMELNVATAEIYKNQYDSNSSQIYE